MKDIGHNRDLKQCRMKLKELRQAYQKTREACGRSGSEPRTCRFYDELHAILGGSATTTPTVLCDSFNGDGGNTEAGFGDEEDSSQQARGETGFPDGQELFLTLDLEPVPPEYTQGCLLDLPGGEGTSEHRRMRGGRQCQSAGKHKMTGRRCGRLKRVRPYRGGQEHLGHDDDGYQSYCTVCCHKAMGCCCVAMQYRVCQHQETYGDSELHACRGMQAGSMLAVGIFNGSGKMTSLGDFSLLLLLQKVINHGSSTSVICLQTQKDSVSLVHIIKAVSQLET
ncbi:hypothetical protein UY3_06138 [Chelonia mydas]|uniref:Myb/SANT-like DNA-binding domain-containing protein n=1 Tax=Chelonia mydas TaxID=8469 RepID=M7BFC2_CHEMY|nr:hypothetical protein UY3_06138 [Chelonia mydas]